MKYLLSILCLFILSCDSGGDEVHGCADSQACNYNPETTIDNNSCEYDCEDIWCDPVGTMTGYDNEDLDCVSECPFFGNWIGVSKSIICSQDCCTSGDANISCIELNISNIDVVYDCSCIEENEGGEDEVGCEDSPDWIETIDCSSYTWVYYNEIIIDSETTQSEEKICEIDGVVGDMLTCITTFNDGAECTATVTDIYQRIE